MNFDFSKMKYKEYENWENQYFIPEKQHSLFLNDINSLNCLLRNLECSNIPKDGCPISGLYFDDKHFNGGTFNFNYVLKARNTPTGKAPKYYSIAHFFTPNMSDNDFSNVTFGEIYYLQSGEIGKARMILWRNHVCFDTEYRLFRDKLSVWKITKSCSKDGYEKEIVFRK